MITSKWVYKAYLKSPASDRKGLAIVVNNNVQFTFVKLIMMTKGVSSFCIKKKKAVKRLP